jgi:hypothetical protein
MNHGWWNLAVFLFWDFFDFRTIRQMTLGQEDNKTLGY